MTDIRVALDARSYVIHIAAGLLDKAEQLAEWIPARQLLVVTNETVAPLYLDKLRRAFNDRNIAEIILPDGEQHKTLGSFEKIVSRLIELRFDRSCSLVALGGGVVGDLTGFAAATYQRGVGFVQIPTTLLAQVDSSVGGKTAVNHPLAKNMIGAFYQPSRVIADTHTLTTLSGRELRAGIAEVIKYGALGDLPFFQWLEDNVQDVLALHPDKLDYAISRSCENKAMIVAQDETEQGVRALLNLGHTFGHAIEAVHGYGNWLHGEAVGCGMCMAAELSNRLGLLSSEDAARITKLIAAAGLPVKQPGLDSVALENAMRVDKKNRDGKIRLVLMRGIGKAFVTDDYPMSALRDVLTVN